MTTNETSWFRDRVPFETVREVILPDLLARRRDSKTLNFWSAACSTGQEPYSLAILLREHAWFTQLSDWTIRLLATDLSEEVLARAQSGRFSQLEIERGLSATLRDKYFRRTETQWELDESVRRMVTFRRLNLSGDWPPMPRMDVILMRNVLVYFDVPTRQQILRKVGRLLRPDGFLILGGAESALHLDTTLKVTRNDGFSFYRFDHARLD